MSQDILITVDCVHPNNPVHMYASDPSIVPDNSQGSSELHVRVPVSTRLRWHAVPLQIADGEVDTGLYHCIISEFKLWPGADPYLRAWGTSNGGGDAPYYNAPGDLRPQQDAGISTQGINLPFIACTTQLANRDETRSPKVAYTFTVDIYRNSERIARKSWDPYVTVYRP